MYGIVSLIEGEAGAGIQAGWAQLADRFGPAIVAGNSLPHLSYHVADDYDVDAVRRVLEPLASRTRPFEALTARVGIASGEFTGAGLNVVRTVELSVLHEEVWAAVAGLGTGVVERYAPDRWMPGIALAGGDQTFAALPELTRMVDMAGSGGPLPPSIRLDNLALIEEVPDGHVTVFRLPFTG